MCVCVCVLFFQYFKVAVPRLLHDMSVYLFVDTIELAH